MSINETKLREVLWELAYRTMSDPEDVANAIEAIFEPDAPVEPLDDPGNAMCPPPPMPAEQPAPTPDRTGTWWIDGSDGQIIHIVKTDWPRHYFNERPDRKLPSLQYIDEADLFSNYRPVPPRPDVPAGKRLTGRIVDCRESDQWVSSVGDIEATKASEVIADTTGYGFRRWEWEQVPAEQPAPAASEAARWELRSIGYELWQGDRYILRLAHSLPADREAILRAFDPDRVSVRRELVEAWERLEAWCRIQQQDPNSATSDMLVAILYDLSKARHAISAIDAAKAKEKS